MQVHYGFAGIARDGYWSPVAVDLISDGAQRAGLLVVGSLDPRYARRLQQRVCRVQLPQ
jgi:hypothetical protein